MNILWLGPHKDFLEHLFVESGDSTCRTDELISRDFLESHRFNWLISYGYRHILKSEILDYFEGRTVNLHISLLPWNKGADPNLWSFLEDTPKGVTIHQIDAGMDTGPIYVQREVLFDDLSNETLASTYAKLTAEIENLFVDSWMDIRSGAIKVSNQLGSGSVHRSKEKKKFAELLTNGWDTPVLSLQGKAL